MRILSICLLLITSSATFAQNSGYFGRHLIVTYPLSTTLWSQGTGVGLDFTINRRISLELLFQTGKNKIFTSPTYYYGYSEVFGNNRDIELTSNPRSRVQFHSLSAGITYFLNSSLPAPLGNYIQLNGGHNIGDFESFYHVVVLSNPFALSPDQYGVPASVSFENVPYRSYSLSFGRRRIFFNTLSIDFRLSANMYRYLFNDPEILSPVKHYGGNLIGFGLSRWGGDSNTNNLYLGRSFGLSGHVIIGFLTI